MTDVRILPPAAKYLIKLIESKIKKRFCERLFFSVTETFYPFTFPLFSAPL